MGRARTHPRQTLKHLPEYVTLTDPKHAADTLQAIRVLQDHRQSDLAEALTVSQAQISQWENGLYEPSIGNFMVWAAALGYKVELYRLEDPEDGDDAAA